MLRVIPLKDATYAVEKFIFYFSVKKSIYYINTNEIPGELLCENILYIFTRENNMLFSHVKISPLLWLHNKSRLSQEKTVSVKSFGISLVSLRSLVKYFSTLEEKFRISKRPCNILYVYIFFQLRGSNPLSLVSSLREEKGITLYMAILEYLCRASDLVV